MSHDSALAKAGVQALLKAAFRCPWPPACAGERQGRT
jgi:hypothetical protein